MLVIFPGALGDLVCLLPAIETLAERHRAARFELMAAPTLAGFFAGRSVFVAGHSIDRAEVASLFADSDTGLAPARRLFGRFGRIYSFFASDNATYRRRLTLACDGVASFHRFRPADMCHVTAGYLTELDLVPEAGNQLEPWVAAQNVHAATASARARIFLKTADFAASEEILSAVGLQRRRFVILMPGSGSPVKNWPAEKFASLAEAISERFPSAILLGPAEHRLKGIFEARRCVVFEGLELPVAAALIASALAFVGNDSGMSHLAAALDVPGVVLFGPTEPALWAPLGRIMIIVGSPLFELDSSEVKTALEQVICSCEPSR
jgi:heptosyltransferase-3